MILTESTQTNVRIAGIAGIVHSKLKFAVFLYFSRILKLPLLEHKLMLESYSVPIALDLTKRVR